MEKTLKPSRQAVERWLLEEIGRTLDKSPQELDPRLPFASLGLDSPAAVALTGDLEEHWGVEVDPTLIFEYPSIQRLLDYLEGEGVLTA